MYGSLLKYYLEQRHWERLSVHEVRHRQTAKFRQLFEFARVHSPFYRKIYTEAGVEKLQIHTFDDIQKVPVVDKAMMRAYMTEEIMTRPITDDLILNTTGGSTGGDPFKIYQTRYEQYTAHLRVFSMLTELGYRPWHLILILWRLEPNAVLAVERDLRLLPRLRESFKFFRREILSVHARPEAIVSWVQARPDAKIFWATPGMLSILCDHLEAREINFHFKRTILSAETLFPAERKRFAPRMGGPVVSQYGMAECPSIGYDTGLDDRTRIFANACMLELLNIKEGNSARHGEVVITNLVNSTMPFIRYNTRDSAMALNDHECPARMIGPIRGRLDDVLTLPGNAPNLSELCHTPFL